MLNQYVQIQAHFSRFWAPGIDGVLLSNWWNNFCWGAHKNDERSQYDFSCTTRPFGEFLWGIFFFLVITSHVKKFPELYNRLDTNLNVVESSNYDTVVLKFQLNHYNQLSGACPNAVEGLFAIPEWAVSRDGADGFLLPNPRKKSDDEKSFEKMYFDIRFLLLTSIVFERSFQVIHGACGDDGKSTSPLHS